MACLRAADWQYVVRLYNASKVAPLAGWPQRYAPWVVDAMSALEHAVAESLASKGDAEG